MRVRAPAVVFARPELRVHAGEVGDTFAEREPARALYQVVRRVLFVALTVRVLSATMPLVPAEYL